MMRRAWPGLVLLTLGPVLFLLALWAWVHFTREEIPETAPFQLVVNPEREVVWPWQQAEFLLTLRADVFLKSLRTEGSTLPRKDLVILLDASSSIDDTEFSSTRTVVMDFIDNLALDIGRVAIYQFSDGLERVVPLTADFPGVRKAIQEMKQLQGETRFLPPLREALKVLSQSSGAAVVLMTDGNGEEPSELYDFRVNEWEKSPHPPDLFLIGIGDGINEQALISLTQDPRRFLVTGLDHGITSQLFELVATNLSEFVGIGGRFQLPVADALFTFPATAQESAPPQSRHPLLPGPRLAKNQWAFTPIFARKYQFSLMAEPGMGGILPLLHHTASYSFLLHDEQNRRMKPVEIQATGSPRVLAVTWNMLLLLYLPLLLYLLSLLSVWLYQRSRNTMEMPDHLPPLSREPQALSIDPYPRDTNPQVQWVPSLIVGLGGSGTQILTHLRQELADSRGSVTGQPLLLALDVARDEVPAKSGKDVAGCLQPFLSPSELFFLSEESCRLDTVIGKRFTPEEPAYALNLAPYRHHGVEALTLRKGTHGSRTLARLALLMELGKGQGSRLVARLESALMALAALPAPDKTRQIWLVANCEGGVGGGWVCDLIVLLRRLAAPLEQKGLSVMIGVLLLGEARFAPGRGCHALQHPPLLFAELDRLANAGRVPFQHVFSAPGSEAPSWSSGQVSRRPMDTMLVMAGEKEQWRQELYPSAAEALMLLLDKVRYREFFATLESRVGDLSRLRRQKSCESFIELSLRSVTYPLSFQTEIVLNRLLQVLLGDRVLFPGLRYHQSSGSWQLEQQAGEASVVPGARPAGSDDEGALLFERLLDVIDGRATSLEDVAGEATRPRDLENELLLWLREIWEERLRSGRWNLATLHHWAQQGAMRLERVKPKEEGELRDLVVDLSQTLTVLAGEVRFWIEQFLGTAERKRMTGELRGVSPSADGMPGWLTESATILQGIEETFREWAYSPARAELAALLLGREDYEGEDNLFWQWLSLWLNKPKDWRKELHDRLGWRLTVTAGQPPRFGLVLDFQGRKRHLVAANQEDLVAWRAEIRQLVTDSLFLIANTRLMPALAEILTEDQVEPFAMKLKGGLRGDDATLFLSLPQQLPGDGEKADQLRQLLRGAFESARTAAESFHYHESLDPFRILALNLSLPLATHLSPSHEQGEPIHPPERLRLDYQQRLQEHFQRLDLLLPTSAGMTLGDEEALRSFARLWKKGAIVGKRSDGLLRVRLRDGTEQLLTHFPDAGLVEAAARFVSQDLANRCDTRSVSQEAPISVAVKPEEEAFVMLLDLLAGEDARERR